MIFLSNLLFSPLPEVLKISSQIEKFYPPIILRERHLWNCEFLRKISQEVRILEKRSMCVISV